MRLDGKRVFLSGPMSNVRYHNVDRFAKAHHVVKAAGARFVYDPAIEFLDGDKTRKPHWWWMAKCLQELTRFFPNSDSRYYDVLVSLPGWRGSDGATTERMVAEACGIEVVDLKDIDE